MIRPRVRSTYGVVEPNIQSTSTDSDDAGDRPTLRDLRKRVPRDSRGLLRRQTFDDVTTLFFSDVETQPELVVDAALVAKLRQAAAPSLDEEVDAWWAAERRRMYVGWVAVVVAACVAVLFAGMIW